MIGEEDGAELGRLLRRILERGEHERPLVQRQREQLHVGFERTLEPVGQVVGAGFTDEVGELVDGVVGDGGPASITGRAYAPECQSSRQALPFCCHAPGRPLSGLG
jgi:hypothetical protein